MVERNAALERKLAGIPDRLVLGNAADREVLIRAGIRKAPSVVLTTHDDATNVYLTLYCRRLNRCGFRPQLCVTGRSDRIRHRAAA
jgi:Trk K+ transport system NAD-binding subunit